MEQIVRDENENRRGFAKRMGIAAIVFFLSMLALTYVSRAVSDALKARVTVGYAGASVLDESVEGTGKWTVGDTVLYTASYSRRITQVYVKAGQTVEEGDPLFAYDVASIKGGKKVSDKALRAARAASEKAEAALETAEDPAYAAFIAENARQALSYAEFTQAQRVALQNGGVVCATFSGTVVKCDLSVGRNAQSGVSGIEIAPAGVRFTLTVTEEAAGRVAAGDKVRLQLDGKEEPTPLAVERVEPPDENGSVQVLCAGGGETERRVGSEQDYVIKKQSGRYNTCVPLSALRQSGPESYYVLVLTERETILGTQLAVRRVNVELLLHDSQRAAVTGDVGERDKLVTGSTKELRDGDLVVEADA